LLSVLQGVLTGVATGIAGPLTYDALISRLDEIHGVSSDRQDAISKLDTCRQHENETIAMFAERVRQLIQRAYPNMLPRDKEEQALRVFLQGLPSKNDIRMKMRTAMFPSMREAVVYGTNLEQIIRDEKGKLMSGRQCTEEEPSSLRKAMEELQKDLRELKSKVSESGQQSKTYPMNQNVIKQQYVKTTPCFSCGEMGHWKRECPYRDDSQRYGGGNYKGQGQLRGQGQIFQGQGQSQYYGGHHSERPSYPPGNQSFGQMHSQSSPNCGNNQPMYTPTPLNSNLTCQ